MTETSPKVVPRPVTYYSPGILSYVILKLGYCSESLAPLLTLIKTLGPCKSSVVMDLLLVHIHHLHSKSKFYPQSVFVVFRKIINYTQRLLL